MSVTSILLDILIVLVAAKVAAEIAERVGFPPVVAEILAGVAIGPSVFDLVGTEQTLQVLGEIGVILLLLQVGMEMDLRELGAVGRASASVAVIGVVLPMAAGFGVSELFGYDANTALFLGAALAATSVGITARVFSDLRALASVEARTVLGAAVADDVLGLVILTVVVRIASEGSVSVLSVLGIFALALAFLVATTAVGIRAAPPLFQFLHRYARSTGTVVALALAFTLAFAELADAAQLAPIVGAFVAGLSLSRSAVSDRISRELAPVGHLFIPVFFLQIGIEVDVDAFFDPTVLAVAGAFLAVAVAGKLAAAAGAFGSPGDKRLIGLGMIPRGEVGLIFATIGLRETILDQEQYAALLLVVLATTLLAPPLLRWRLQQLRAERAQRRHPSTAPPGGRWLVTRGGEVDLVGSPPEGIALTLALEAAQAISRGNLRPGRALLYYLGDLGDAPLRWDWDASRRLFEVLRTGDARTWRFLETTGILERALPELAEALRRRRADPFVIDPTHVLSFSLVDAIRDLVGTDQRAAAEYARLEHHEWLLLAALILDTAGEDASPIDLARRLAGRLDLGAAAEQEIALLVGDSGLLRAAAQRVDGFDEERVFALATHLDRPERTRALYLLTLALGGLEPWDRARVEELKDVVLAVLDQPDLTGLEARNLVERRRAEAVRTAGPDRAVAERIEHAPRTYLLAQEAADVARAAALLEPLPARGRARVAVAPLEGGAATAALPTVAAEPELATAPVGQFRVEVASRDRPGLLATVSGALADSGLTVLDAVVATWGDGGALDSFRVMPVGRMAPDAYALTTAIVEAFERPLEAPATPGAEIAYDDDGSPWYTLAEVRCPDCPGLLHAITVGFASVGVNVHSAQVLTVNGQATDRFELTDGNGRKLGDAAKRAVRDAVTGGVRTGRRGRLLRRNGR
ncbi:MAG TPA: cation:proton antiporter [Acidimicrobiia bacterium]|nr:cation:proton antiporter [Acidimicrobiia bacterium]